MSVWAQSWAYEQRLGRWRETNRGKKTWKGDPGAKSVLAAVATFADANGYAYCGQDTLAEVTDMTERSVREHLHNLEHAYGKIRREHRRKGSGRGRGEFTSDGIWLLAPAHRLRPPRRGEEIAAEEPPESFSVGEKRAHRRKSLPPGGRKGFPGNRQGSEPSGDPSVVPASPGHRPETYAGMVEEQARLLGVPLDPGEHRNLCAYAGRLIEDQGASPLSMLRWAVHYATRRAENPKIQPSQAWADVATVRGDGDYRSGHPRALGSIAVVGTSEADYEGNF
jgi:hypothetical protein